MKATLEYQLPEDAEEFHIAVKAMAYRMTLIDIMECIRQKVKYSPLNDEQYKIYEDLQREFFSIIENNDIRI